MSKIESPRVKVVYAILRNMQRAMPETFGKGVKIDTYPARLILYSPDNLSTFHYADWVHEAVSAVPFTSYYLHFSEFDKRLEAHIFLRLTDERSVLESERREAVRY